MSTWYVIRVIATGEKKNFLTEKECLSWAQKVRDTFMDQNMKFDLAKVIETHKEI